MAHSNGVNVFSEIGRLRRVILHRPGPELDNLTPLNMKNLLFDDIPDYVAASKEHDELAQVLQKAGAEVMYVTDIMEEVLADREIRSALLADFLREARVFQLSNKLIFDYLFSMEDTKRLVNILIGGLRRDEFTLNGSSLSTLDRKKTLHFDPMPNMYYTRDPMTVIGSGLSLNCMWAETRRRESLMTQFALEHHPRFKDIRRYYDRNENATLEGGDILVLSKEVLAVGVSQRSETAAVKTLARRVLRANDGFSHVLVFFIPERRAFMHLDTVFTMVDREIFTVHPEIEGPLEIYDITANKDGELEVKNIGNHLSSILKKYLHLSEVELIRCGGTSQIDAQREQWNDGSNTLAIAPGEVVVYDRNRVTNRLLKEAGITLHEISSSELSRGRGGPRCMSQPIWRDDID